MVSAKDICRLTGQTSLLLKKVHSRAANRKGAIIAVFCKWSEMTQQVGAGAGPEDFCFRKSLLPCQENRHRSAMKMHRLMKAVIMIPPSALKKKKV